MLKTMKSAALLLAIAVLPALADTRFQVRRVSRSNIPLGRGQCDIRLQVDSEVEVTVRGDMVDVHTLAGKDARDDGSECNAPLPAHPAGGFHFEVKESRNEIHLAAEPSVQNGFAAIVEIRDTSGGTGRYQFRLSWVMEANEVHRLEGSPDRPRAPPGFAWNNTISFRGNGRGEAWLNDFGPLPLAEVKIDIDQSGKVLCWFRSGRGRGFTFNGDVVAHEQNRWKADVMSDDHRYRGPLYFSVDPKGNIGSVSIDAGDGRDRMQLNWDRR